LWGTPPHPRQGDPAPLGNIRSRGRVGGHPHTPGRETLHPFGAVGIVLGDTPTPPGRGNPAPLVMGE